MNMKNSLKTLLKTAVNESAGQIINCTRHTPIITDNHRKSNLKWKCATTLCNYKNDL